MVFTMTGPAAGALTRTRSVDPRLRAGALAALLALACWLLATEALRTAASGPAVARGTQSSRAAALGPISAALGADDPAYRLSSTGGAVRGYNPAQRVSLLATSHGVTLRSGDLQLGLRLQALGFGGASTPVAAARV
jgi:hypothetical protein